MNGEPRRSIEKSGMETGESRIFERKPEAKSFKEPVTEIRIERHCRSVRVFRSWHETSGFCEAARQRDARSRESLQSLRSAARFYGDEAPVAVGDAAFVQDKEVAMRTGHSTMRRRIRRRT